MSETQCASNENPVDYLRLRLRLAQKRRNLTRATFRDFAELRWAIMQPTPSSLDEDKS
jgi:hypothetical protein